MPDQFRTAGRRGEVLSATGMFIAAVSLVLGSSGAADAAGTATGTAGGKGSGQAPGDEHRQLKPGDASLGVGVRMHEGDSRRTVTPKPLAATVHGVDVSSHQRNVNWSKLSKSGVKWAYVKATEGTSYTNDYFSQQYNGSYKSGMTRGAYHFAIPNKSSGATQAKHFLGHGGGWSKDGRTLPGVLDIEYNPYGATCYGKSASAMVDWIKDFNRTYKARTGRAPVIYTTTAWWSKCTDNSGSFGRTNPLWVARFGSSPGSLPKGWGFYTFWQYTAKGPTVGDHNLFNGSASRLKALARG